MAKNKCARAVMLAAIAASGFGTAGAAVPKASINPEVALSGAVAGSVPLAQLQTTAAARPRSVNVDQGNMHVHINEQPRVGESSFEV